MGGCRCNFRQCHVSYAKFPHMHFFRFPLKDPELYKKWRQFSKMEHMLSFTEVRRKNTKICGRHFRLECFMNYKMDRLAPNAVPTLIRLSSDHALDFELDIENGVLVTLEQTKLKHLIPPDDFECPLFLMNDTILIEKLNELNVQQYFGNTDLAREVPYIDLQKSVEYQGINVGKPDKTLVNSVEILETIQVTAPNSKRPREIEVGSAVSKKYRILNTTNCAGDFNTGTETVLTSQSIQLENCEVNRDEIDFANSQELVNNEEQLFLTGEVYINGDSEDNIEFFEQHKHSNESHCELPSSYSNTTIVELKSDEHSNSSVTKDIHDELIKMQDQLTEFKKKSEDLNILQVKYSIMEAEKNQLEKACEENKETNRKLLTLQIENNCIKKSLQDYKTLKDKLYKYCDENKKLKEETANIEILRSELLSRKEEAKELKKLLETLKNAPPKNQDKEKVNFEVESNRTGSKTNESKLIEELKQTQQQLKHSETELEAVMSSLNAIKNQNDVLTQNQKELEQSLNNIENDFDIKQNDYTTLKSDYQDILQKYTVLEQKYLKIQALQNQENTVSTSLENMSTNDIANPTVAVMPSISSNFLTKAQLFNGIKRYLSSSMVSLLRMEMFGSSERQWKKDERQIALDLFRLGEMVYKYFSDEWRLRLPAVRDVRAWLSQSQEMLDEEDDF